MNYSSHLWHVKLGTSSLFSSSSFLKTTLTQLNKFGSFRQTFSLCRKILKDESMNCLDNNSRFWNEKFPSRRSFNNDHSCRRWPTNCLPWVLFHEQWDNWNLVLLLLCLAPFLQFPFYLVVSCAPVIKVITKYLCQKKV